MKTTLTLSFLAMSLAAFAQNSVGKITYEENVKLNIQLEGDFSEEIMSRIPKEKSENYELLFNENESLYHPSEVQKENSHAGGSFIQQDGGHVEIIAKKSNNETYYDLTKDRLIQKTDFMDRTFLVKGEIEAKSWKILPETKEILGYKCSKASYTEDSTTFIAWYTTQLPSKIGPNRFIGLPGAILEVSSEDGNKSIIASNVELGTDYSDLIVLPKKGKEITQAEFNKLKEEKFKEMEEEYGPNKGGGNVKVFIQKQ